MKKKIYNFITGYCALCRAKEIELYGTVLNETGPKHHEACLLAGCKHPSHYRIK